MKGQGVSNIQQVDELGNLAIRVACDVHNGAVALGRLGQAMNRHDGKELAEGPMIEERLKDGEIADVLIAQRSFELLYFVRDKSQTAMHADDLGGPLPVSAIDLCCCHEVERCKAESLLGLFFDLRDVVQGLERV